MYLLSFHLPSVGGQLRMSVSSVPRILAQLEHERVMVPLLRVRTKCLRFDGHFYRSRKRVRLRENTTLL